MKKILVCFVFLSWCCVSYAQVASINENFDASCATSGPNYPAGWTEYNIIPPTTSLAWNCTPTNGKSGTPGMRCSGYFSAAYHLDTAWLFTPEIAIDTTTDSVYLRFDSKYEVGVLKENLGLRIFYNKDTTYPLWDTAHNTNYDLTSALSPIIGHDDSLGWVTHFLNLTPYKVAHPHIYIAFRYISTNTAAGAWTIDNVNTTSFPLESKLLPEKANASKLSASYFDGDLTVHFKTSASGNYNIELFDLTGRSLFKNEIETIDKTENSYIIKQQIKNGLYILRMWSSKEMQTVKVPVY